MSEKNKEYESDYNSRMQYMNDKYCQDMIKLYGEEEGMKKYLDFKNSLIQQANGKK